MPRLVKNKSRAGLALVLLLATSLISTAAAAALIDIQPASDGARNGLRLVFDDTPPTPSVFTIEDPARLTLDMPGTNLGLTQRYRTIERGGIESVAAAETGDKTRLVVNLTRLVDYDIQRKPRALLVFFGADQPSGATPGAAAQTITDIDFRRADNGAGRIKITLDGTQAPVDIGRQGQRVVARLSGIALPARLSRRLDVTDFATPVATIDARDQGADTQIVITPRAEAVYERLAYQTGNDLVIELRGLDRAERADNAARQPRYDGEKISLSFQDIDVRTVLQIMAETAGVNMVVADSVTGTIALQLDDVPWDQALDIVLDAKNLGMQRQNNVISVAPLSEIAARQAAKAEARRATRELAPLQSEIIQINYASAADMANIVQSDTVTTRQSFVAPTRATPGLDFAGGDNDLAGAVSPFSRTSTRAQRTVNTSTDSERDEHSLLSPRGHVTVDDRTNTLLITDTAAKIEQIRNLINRLDIPVRQVLIESRIVVANRDFTRNLGVSQTGVDSSRLNNALGAGDGLGNAYNANNGGYAVALPAQGATSLLSTSIVTDTFSLNLELTAMEMENNGEIISSPRIITADGREANIEQGREIPYQSGTAGGLAGATVEFKKAVLGLNVTPKITPDKKVIMNLNVTQDSVGEFVPTSQGGQVPSIDTRSLTTQVLVDNGDTVVLGGIFEQNDSNQTGSVPFVSKIPLIGALFTNRSLERQKRELLIFVTPKILENQASLQSR